MAKKRVTQAAVAEHIGVARRTLCDLLDRGALTRPLELDRNRREYIAHLQQVAAGRERADRPGRNGSRADPAETARAVLKGFALPQTHLVPWRVPPDDLVDVTEYERTVGLEPGGILDLLVYSLPLVEPASGTKVARVSLGHAERHRFLLAVLLHQLAGVQLLAEDGRVNLASMARLAPELHRLRGVG